MRRETSVDGIVKIFFRLASDCLKQFYIIVTLQKRPKIDTLNFDKLLLQFVVVVIKQAVIKSEIILRRLANIKFQQKRSTKVLLGGHIYLLWFKGIVLYKKNTQSVQKRSSEFNHSEFITDAKKQIDNEIDSPGLLSFKRKVFTNPASTSDDEDDDAKENSLSLSPSISKIVETQLMSRTPVFFFGDACIKRTSRYSTFPSQVNQSQFRLAIKSIFHLIRKKQEKTRRETSVDGI
jgi:hypothetical protein